jgi:hypothetical protein
MTATLEQDERLKLAWIKIDTYTMPQLKNLARVLGMKGYSRLRAGALKIEVAKTQQKILRDRGIWG